MPSTTPLLHPDTTKDTTHAQDAPPSRLAQNAILVVGAVRVIVGAACLVAPMTVARMFYLPITAETTLMARLVGVRDAVLGELTILSSKSAVAAAFPTAAEPAPGPGVVAAKKENVRRVLWAGIAADAADIAVCGAMVAAGQLGWPGFGAMAAGASLFIGLAGKAIQGFR